MRELGFALTAISVMFIVGVAMLADVRDEHAKRGHVSQPELGTSQGGRTTITVGNHSYIPLFLNREECEEPGVILNELKRFEDYNSTILQVTNWSILYGMNPRRIDGIFVDHQPKTAPSQK